MNLIAFFVLLRVCFQDDRELIIQYYLLCLTPTSTVMSSHIPASSLTWKRVVKVRICGKVWVWFLLDFSIFHKLLIDFYRFVLGWHYCGKQSCLNVPVADCYNRCRLILDIDGRQATFLCPNGTQFSQAVFVCDWWFNVRCDLSPRLYAINARLYQRPKVNPTKPHRIITKELVDDIFNK